jgi:signal peptidase I
MKITWKQIGIFLVLLFLIIGLANILFRYVLPITPVKYISSNMEPTYSKGDVLFYSSAETYDVEDVIIYKTKTPYPGVVRIVGINEDGSFIAKGDANLNSINTGYLDETHINKEQIIGKIVFSTKSIIFYPLVYGIEIILAIILTLIISRKIKK